MNFQDPENLTELLNSIPNTPSELVSFIKRTFDGWIVNTASQFAEELQVFNYQWATACVEMKVEPQKVLFVSNTFMKERTENRNNHNYKLIEKFSIDLLQKGFVVVPLEFFDKCSMCNRVIVSKKNMEAKGLVFSGKCQGCYRYDPRRF